MSTRFEDRLLAELREVVAGEPEPTVARSTTASGFRTWQPWRKVAALTAGLVVVGGGATVVASSVLSENGMSNDIRAVDVGVPGEPGSGIIAKGSLDGAPWLVRAAVESPVRICYTEERGLIREAGTSCETVTPQMAGDPGYWGWGGIQGMTEGATDGYAWGTGRAGAAVDHLEISWPGAKAPVVVRPVEVAPGVRAFTFLVKAHNGGPNVKVRGFDAQGRELKTPL
ncbi:hypothetical protein [Yinghuangia seranimata]|uniref:hypothetical protein n=1 Tax=Yinghuangia seranimata TaxID=408067 RepID=UPI00248BCAFA|nr:hypothetical protein [Yinghuangia seranimata]MDI2127848.1 hypothetical protein [Yinghuangia seranimata]